MRITWRPILLLMIAINAAPAAARYTVCTATLNSSEEREVFRARLDADQFEFRELTEFAAAPGSGDWFAEACRADLRCDVLVISGHFAGSFFGKLGFNLDLRTLERSACQESCPGVLGHLREAYLFGCNTLAGKDADRRTPEQYLNVLIGDGIARPEAERIVAARYGPFGSSYRDRVERVFENTPVIYGFSSVGPSGANVKASLGAYLTRVGDYKAHLDQISAGADTRAWFETMSAYARATGTGLTKSHPLYPVKENMCALDDDRRTVAERVGLVASFLDTDPMLYLTTIASFANTHLAADRLTSTDPDTNDVKSSLRQMVQRRDLAAVFEKVQGSPGVTPSIRVDLLGAARNIGWMSTAEYERNVRTMFASYTKRLDADGADFVCAQTDHDAKLAAFIDESHLLGYAYDQPFQFRLASCALNSNPKLTAAVVAGFERNAGRLSRGKIEQRASVLIAMIALKGEDWGRARVLRTFLTYRGPHEAAVLNLVRAHLVGLTRAEEQTALVRKLLAGGKDISTLSTLLDGLARSPERNEPALRLATEALFSYAHAELAGLSLPADLFSDTREAHEELARRLRASDLVPDVALALETHARARAPALVEVLVDWVARVAASDDYAVMSPFQRAVNLLIQSELTPAQLEMLKVAYYRSSGYNRPYLRALLFDRGVDDDTVRRDVKLRTRCGRGTTGGRECRYETFY